MICRSPLPNTTLSFSLLHQLFGSCLLFGLEFISIGQFDGNSLQSTLGWWWCLAASCRRFQVSRRRGSGRFSHLSWTIARLRRRWQVIVNQGTQRIVSFVSSSDFGNASWTYRSIIVVQIDRGRRTRPETTR